jgi:hypothetical protein
VYGPNASSGVGCSAVRRLLRRSRCCGPNPTRTVGGGLGLRELAEFAGLPGNTGGRWRASSRASRAASRRWIAVARLAGGSRGLGLSTWDAPIKVVGVLEVPNHSAPVSPTGAFSWEWILSFHVQGVDCQMQCGGRPTVRVWRLCRLAS